MMSKAYSISYRANSIGIRFEYSDFLLGRKRSRNLGSIPLPRSFLDGSDRITIAARVRDLLLQRQICSVEVSILLREHVGVVHIPRIHQRIPAPTGHRLIALVSNLRRNKAVGLIGVDL